MFFALYCLDKPISTGLRAVTRDEHIAYIQRSGAMVRLAGPMMSNDGQKMIGSLLVIEADTLDDARAWAQNDPYAKAGLFEIADIHVWNWSITDGKRREA